MRTFVQVLILELDETEGDPANWNWQEMIDTPGSVFTAPSVEIESDPDDEQVDTLHRIIEGYRSDIKTALGLYTKAEA